LRSFHLEVPSPKADLSLNINGKVLVSSKNEKALSGVPSSASGYTQTELQLVENSMGKSPEDERWFWLQPNSLASVWDRLLALLAALRNFLASEFRREIPKFLGCRGQQAAGLPNGTGKFI
jgi:hypothetical protein